MDPFSTSATIAGGLQLAKTVSNGLRTVNSVKNHAMNVLKNGSLIDIARVARVEPILVVDADVMNVDFLSDVINSMHTQFSGYYLQAVNLLGTIGGVSVAEKLAPLNPNRGMAFEARQDWRYASESYKHRLPTTHNKLAMAMEQSTLELADKEGLASIKDAANLSTGKMFNVKITEDGKSAIVPVAIRVMVSIIPTRSMVGMFSFKDGVDMSMGERWHGYKAGRLEFIKDLILCRDILDKHRVALMKDRDGVYSQIIGRETSNKMKGLFSGNPSLATASNLAVISTETADAIEQKLNGRLKDSKTRSTMFANTNHMILAIVDKQWERVTFYYRGMHESTQVSAKELKSSNKSGGSEVMDVMKAFIAGSTPNI